MKFGEELERERVQEWAVKYLDYKAGKKHIKAIADAIHKADATAPSPHQRPVSRALPPSPLPSPVPQNQDPKPGKKQNPDHDASLILPRPLDDDQISPDQAAQDPKLQPKPIWIRRDSRSGESCHKQEVHFGAAPSRLEYVPESANSSSMRRPVAVPQAGVTTSSDSPTELPKPLRNLSGNGLKLDVMGLGINRKASLPLEVTDLGESTNTPCRTRPGTVRRRGTINALLSAFPFSAVRKHMHFNDFSLQPLNPTDPIERRKDEFFRFALSEFRKVEDFYKSKEDQAGERLRLLRMQLHEMRNRRADEIADAQNRVQEVETKEKAKWIDRVKKKMIAMVPGPIMAPKTPWTAHPHTPIYTALPGDARRDFVPRVGEVDVLYSEAKRKLKQALLEYYRGLDLLKAYAELNRTAFRKLNKKYDKTVNARNRLEFMREYVDRSWFVRSDVVDEHIQTAEDLYARYFERGNAKAAISKLRAHKKTRDESRSAFWNGLLIGLGFVFAVQGLIQGVQLLNTDDADAGKVVSSHLQIYGGYFLMLCLFFLFCLVCWTWTESRINYPFIFEFDSTSRLDWRRLAEFPSAAILIFGVLFWFNFNGYGGRDLFLWYPVFLISLSLVLILLPFRILHYQSRKWFAFAHGRLLLAGFYPVEFRDVFLGDIYCSLTYSVSNIELFFCVYANGWDEPEKCGSSHSRLMSFLSALPPIWRALQCLRRYYDSRTVFPHLVNFGKYCMSIMSIVTLSLYRIQRSHENLAWFIIFNLINSIYSSIWDLYMDFNLMDRHSKNFLLRDILGFKSHWVYYATMVVDPVLRLSWIPLAVFTHNIQHSGLLSFFIAFVEAVRRAIWTVFRVENEHCANIAQNRASRDVSLPYKIDIIGGRDTENSPSATSSVAELASGVEADTPFMEEGHSTRRRIGTLR